MIVPLFPLQRIFLFPRAILPLHIFEARYRQMVEDLLDTAGRLVIGTVREDARAGAEPAPVYPVAGLGEIAGHQKLPDGRYIIALHGLSRVRLEEVESDRLYRRVKADVLEETPISPEAEPELRDQLMHTIDDLADKPITLPASTKTDRLIDFLLAQLDVPASQMASLFSNPCLDARARGALRAGASAGVGESRPTRRRDDGVDPHRL